tara:strand:+ start:53966 stop:54583 length:618 start_codon:yes stop_codon:yes gene_type:complete
MLKKILFLFLLSNSVLAYCQYKSAEEILEKISSKINNSKNLSFKFSYSSDNSILEFGEIIFSEKKYLLEFMGIQQICDGKKIYTIIPENKEVIISEFEDDVSIVSPSNLLSFYKEGYKILIEKKSEKPDGLEFLKLIPEFNDNEISHINMKVDLKENYIKEIHEFRKEGLVNVFKIIKIQFDKKILENPFKFDKNQYKGYYFEEF